MNINQNGSTNSVKQGAQAVAKMRLGGLGAAAAAAAIRVPYAADKAGPQKMPTENNPFKNLYRDSLRKMSSEAAQEILLQRRGSLGRVLGRMVGEIVGQVSNQ